MGNCVYKGRLRATSKSRFMIKVMTWNGGVMELYPPVTAECITNGFPGHGLYGSRDGFSFPLLHKDELVCGELYYLRPLNTSYPGAVPSVSAPYRISFDHHGVWSWQDNIDQPFPKFSSAAPGGGVWRVKLVISPEQLSEILSQESLTEALIESVRTVAKCGNGTAAASVASSDQWSLSSSRKDLSEKVIASG